MGKKNKTAETNQVDPWADPTDEQPKVKKDKPPKTSSNDFSDLAGPGSGGSFKPEDQENELLLIRPISLEEGIKTTFGEKDAIKADVVVLDRSRPAKSEEIKDALIFGRVMQGQLQQALARKSKVVGTLIKDTASQKPGQKPPWRITAPTNDDIEVAKAYLDSLG